jgi:hypothetical protein
MEYQGLQYTVVQGIERGVWKWSVSVDGVLLRGETETRWAAIAAAQKTIDRAKAAAVKKVRLVPPEKPT